MNENLISKTNKAYYPKILIISETFKSNSGGGITLSNLFRGYPKDCLANAIDGYFIKDIYNDEICENFYSLGYKEKVIIKPFSIFFNKYQSGKYNYYSKTNRNLKFKENEISRFKNLLVKLYFWFSKFTGLEHLMIRYKISDVFKLWIDEFKPDIIYSQLSSLEMIIFTNDLLSITNAKLAIHIMDDWPKVVANNCIFKEYWQKKIDSEFRAILDKASLLMSISEGMTNEYKKRYNKTFIPFHNPIDIDYWSVYSKKNFDIDKYNIKVLYAGRIGRGTNKSIFDIVTSIAELNKSNEIKIDFIIQTTTVNKRIRRKLTKFNFVKFNPIVELSELPKIFSSVDILVLPIDFTKDGMNFLKFSMPTKASEFMISGTPILLYCHSNVYLYHHALKYGWAYIVSENNNERIKSGIMELINDYDLRIKLSFNATTFSKNNFSSTYVRNNFQNCFVEIMKH